MSHRPWTTKKQERTTRILKRLIERDGSEVSEHLLPLRLGEEISVAFELDVRVVRGHVEVYGAILGPSLSFSRIVAPDWAALPRLRAVPSKKEHDTAEMEEEEDVTTLLQGFGWPVVLCLRNPRAAAQVPTRRPAHLTASLLADESWPRLCKPLAWGSIEEHVQRLWKERSVPSSRPFAMLVMGPKGVGKSTCCRHFVNSLLRFTGEVFFFETDLGQPELGVPGTVAVHLMRKPLLQPPHAEHEHECVARFFVGCTTPAEHPSLYVNAMRSAFDACVESLRHRKGPSPPLVVNSHGWVTGLGLELVRLIAGLVGAELVLRINPLRSEALPGGSVDAPTEASGEARTRIAAPTHLVRNAVVRCGPLSMELGAEAGTWASELPSCVLVDLQSAVGQRPEVATRLTRKKPLHHLAAKMRWMRVAHYFRPDLPPCAHPVGVPAGRFFSSVPRRRLPLGLHFGLTQGVLREEDIEIVFTGCVVGLCCLRNGHPSETGTVSAGQVEQARVKPRALPEAVSSLRCIATAFVHSFDTVQGEVVVYTPASVEALSPVDCVLRGEHVWHPQSIDGQFLSAEGQDTTSMSSPLHPYCSAWTLDGLGTGSRLPSTRPFLKRKRGT